MILDDIIFNKRQEVTVLKIELGKKDLPRLIKGLPQPRNFLKAFPKRKISLIAEIKRASPSVGVIRADLNPVALAKTYEKAGASALSVLTDRKFFQGRIEDLSAVKHAVSVPVLCKDFIIDEAQIYEARIAGADAVLLIARILEKDRLNEFLKLVEKLGMQALVEAHDEKDVERVLKTKARIIGINNRDLQSFEVDLSNTLRLMKGFAELKKRLVVSESGIRTLQDIEALRRAGVSGVLIGTTLLKAQNIPQKIKELLG